MRWKEHGRIDATKPRNVDIAGFAIGSATIVGGAISGQRGLIVVGALALALLFLIRAKEVWQTKQERKSSQEALFRALVVQSMVFGLIGIVGGILFLTVWYVPFTAGCLFVASALLMGFVGFLAWGRKGG